MQTSDRDQAYARRSGAGSVGITSVIERVERAEPLDRVAEWVAGPARRVLSSERVRDVLSGTWLGHPLHPALIALPLGCWSAAPLMDLSGERDAARKLIGAGLIAAAPTALTGWSDWLDTSGAERRVGLVHLASNSAAVTLLAASWQARRRGRTVRGAALTLAGVGMAGLGGWLGGHLSYALGVGVDTNAFDAGPSDWTPLGVEVPPDGRPVRSVVGSTPVVAVRQPTGVSVMAERCSHRGGPLSEGEVDDGCLTCPWHGSRFDLATGGVRRGPAVVGQPFYEVDDAPAGVMVRRSEPRALRSNTVKP